MAEAAPATMAAPAATCAVGIPLLMLQSAVNDDGDATFVQLMRVLECFAAMQRQHAERGGDPPRQLLPWWAAAKQDHKVLIEFLKLTHAFRRRLDPMPDARRRRLAALVAALYDAVSPAQRVAFYHRPEPTTGQSWLRCAIDGNGCPELVEALVRRCGCRFNARDAVTSPYIIHALVAHNMHRVKRPHSPAARVQ
jgi:AcrR family transcriptional regulator